MKLSGLVHFPAVRRQQPAGAQPLRALAICLCILALAGCSTGRAVRPDSYTVKPGDTLSEIGQRFNINWHDLARWNHLQPPYRLSVGEHLTLKRFPRLDYAHMPSSTGGGSAPSAPSGNAPQRASAPPSAGRAEALPQRSLPTVSSSGSSAPNGTAATTSGGGNAAGGLASIGASSTPNESAPAGGSANAAASRQAPAGSESPSGSPSNNGWQWPTSGPLLHGYDARDRQRGIEIGGKLGAPIRAAAGGAVVYNGIGLKGYGKLIIIKHNAHYLSAYGFNKKSLVKQGEKVSAGQHIADMGLGPGNKPMLHFEIRRDGDPVNPLKLLPKR